MIVTIMMSMMMSFMIMMMRRVSFDCCNRDRNTIRFSGRDETILSTALVMTTVADIFAGLPRIRRRIKRSTDPFSAWSAPRQTANIPAFETRGS
jgi:hypothetical protein